MFNFLKYQTYASSKYRQNEKKEESIFADLSLFLAVIIVFAFIEEGFWDSFIWREHAQYFSSYYFLPAATSPWGVALALSLLILPQVTHYLLDGFIWKTNGQQRSWKIWTRLDLSF